MTHVKICGITNTSDARAAVDAGASAIGLVFADSQRRVDQDTARRIVSSVDGRCACVGVFVGDSPNAIASVVHNCGLDFAQVYALTFQDYFDRLGNVLLPACTVRNGVIGLEDELNRLRAVVLDAPHPNRESGSVIPYDWEVARDLGRQTSVLIAGGLNRDNVTSALDTARPYGVDISGGVEIEPGKKDHSKIVEFIKKVQQWDYRTNADTSADSAAASFLKP
jgi:phosphoribosylanthranilate isomerase